MFNKLFPNKYIDSVFELDTSQIKENNINTVIFDIDNTLVPYFITTPDEKLKRLFIKFKRAGIKVGVLSNNNEDRVKAFCADLDVIYVSRAFKPGIKGIRRLIKCIGSEPSETMMVGDQIFTDVWCGNRAGITTVLVKPVSKKDDEWITWIKRGLEKKLINLYLKKEEAKNND